MGMLTLSYTVHKWQTTIAAFGALMVKASADTNIKIFTVMELRRVKLKVTFNLLISYPVKRNY